MRGGKGQAGDFGCEGGRRGRGGNTPAEVPADAQDEGQEESEECEMEETGSGAVTAPYYPPGVASYKNSKAF